jgi:multiple sugar transport system permease protein
MDAKALLFRLVGRIVLGAFVFWSFAPIAFIVVSSFKPPAQVLSYPPTWVFTPTLENYLSLAREWQGFFVALGNSLIVAVGATLLSSLISICAGFVYSRYRSRGMALSAFYMIAIRLLPPIVVTLPLFPAVDYLGLSDTHAILIILYASFWVSLQTMIMKTFIDEVPKEIDESATVDGVGAFYFLIRILFPLSLQGLAASSIFVFVFSWNEFLFALIFTTQRAATAPLVISQVMDSIYGTNWGVLFAGVTIQIAPVLALVALAQRWLIAGLTAGSVKG